MTEGGKLKIGMYWASSCGGCDISLLEIGSRILDLVQVEEVAFWPCVADFKYESVAGYPDGHLDVCFFNGGVRNSEQEEIARLLRNKSRMLVAYGAWNLVPSVAPRSRSAGTVTSLHHVLGTGKGATERHEVHVRWDGGTGSIDDASLWSCTTCGACVRECPVSIEPAPKILDLRRQLVMEETRLPATMEAALKSIEDRSHPYKGAGGDRTQWSAGLDIPLAQAGGDYDVLYWVGCTAAFDPRARQVARALVVLLRRAGLRVAVLGNDEPQVSLPGEIIPAREWYDYDAKYVDEETRLILPAPLPQATTDEVRRLAALAFKAIDASGLSRVDFLLDRGTGELWLSEINTMPGFTPTSMFPRMWAATGVDYASLVDRLIRLALQRDTGLR